MGREEQETDTTHFGALVGVLFCFVNLSSWGGGGRTKESKHSDTERHLDFLSSFRDDLEAGLPMIKGQLVKPGWVLTVAQPFPELCDLRQALQIL